MSIQRDSMCRRVLARGKESLPAELHLRCARLICDIVAAERTAHGLEVDSRDSLEAVEAATREQERLVLTHPSPNRAQLAPEVKAPA